MCWQPIPKEQKLFSAHMLFQLFEMAYYSYFINRSRMALQKQFSFAASYHTNYCSEKTDVFPRTSWLDNQRMAFNAPSASDCRSFCNSWFIMKTKKKPMSLCPFFLDSGKYEFSIAWSLSHPLPWLWVPAFSSWLWSRVWFFPHLWRLTVVSVLAGLWFWALLSLFSCIFPPSYWLPQNLP